MTKGIINIVLGLLLVVSYSACAQGQTKNNGDKMKTIEINKEQFLQNVVNYEANPTEWKYLGNKPAIIDFYASWCGPCKMVAPILEELASEYGDSIVIYKVNTEKEQELSAAFGIRSIPTIIFAPMEGNPQVAQGAMGKAEFKRLIDEILLKK
jgi:thioredoxin